MKDLKTYIFDALISSKTTLDFTTPKINKIKERKLRGIKQVFNMILDIFDFSKEKFVEKIVLKENASNTDILYLCKDELSIRIEYLKNSYEHMINIYLHPTDMFDIKKGSFIDDMPTTYHFVYIIEWGNKKIKSYDDLRSYVFERLDRIKENTDLVNALPNYDKYVKILKNIFDFKK